LPLLERLLEGKQKTGSEGVFNPQFSGVTGQVVE